MTRILAALALFALLQGPALAHKPSDSYLALQAAGDRIVGQWDIALRDLEYAIGIDANGDGAITWGELRAQHAAIDRYALARLKLTQAGRECPIRATDHLVDDHSDGAYAVLVFEAECGPAAGEGVALEYSLFFDLDPTHRGLLRWQAGERTVTAVLGPDNPTFRLATEPVSRIGQFLAYGKEGVWHIWIGIDHMLFLISLLLPAVYTGSRRGWEPVASFMPAFWDVAKVVTAFTVAIRSRCLSRRSRSSASRRESLKPRSRSRCCSRPSTTSTPSCTGGAGWSPSRSGSSTASASRACWPIWACRKVRCSSRSSASMSAWKPASC